MTTEAIKELLYQNHITRWELADALNVGEATIYRWLRHQLSEEKEKRILAAIEELKGEQGK